MDFLADFGVQPLLLAAQVVNFLILLFILKKFLYKPILKVLETRKELIVKTLKNADESERILLETNEKADRIIAKSLEEAKKILDETNKAGALMLEDYNKTGVGILQKASEAALKFNEIEREKLKQEIRENLADLVALAFEKVTGKMISKKEQKQLIEKNIKELRV